MDSRRSPEAVGWNEFVLCTIEQSGSVCANFLSKLICASGYILGKINFRYNFDVILDNKNDLKIFNK